MNKATALADELERRATDPMWADHCEISKTLLLKAVAALRAVPQVRVTAMPTIDLLDLADAIHGAREQFLNAMGMPSEALWNDNGSFAPALRELADRRTLNAPASGGMVQSSTEQAEAPIGHQK